MPDHDRIAAIRQAHEASTHPEWRDSTDIGVLLTRIAELERVEKAAREIAYEIERMEALSQVPQLGQIAWWRGHLREALSRSGTEPPAG